MSDPTMIVQPVLVVLLLAALAWVIVRSIATIRSKSTDDHHREGIINPMVERVLRQLGWERIWWAHEITAWTEQQLGSATTEVAKIVGAIPIIEGYQLIGIAWESGLINCGGDLPGRPYHNYLLVLSNSTGQVCLAPILASHPNNFDADQWSDKILGQGIFSQTRVIDIKCRPAQVLHSHKAIKLLVGEANLRLVLIPDLPVQHPATMSESFDARVPNGA